MKQTQKMHNTVHSMIFICIYLSCIDRVWFEKHSKSIVPKAISKFLFARVTERRLLSIGVVITGRKPITVRGGKCSLAGT